MLRLLLPTLGLFVIASGVLLANIYPYYPNSLAGWGLLVLLSLPIVVAVELVGDKLLGAPFVAKLPRTLRIVYAVVALVATIGALMFALQVLEPHLSKWGG